jgi:hypothetical protein
VISERLDPWRQRVTAEAGLREALLAEIRPEPVRTETRPGPALTMPTGAAQSPAGEPKPLPWHPAPPRFTNVRKLLKRLGNPRSHKRGLTIADRCLAAQDAGRRSAAGGRGMIKPDAELVTGPEPREPDAETPLCGGLTDADMVGCRWISGSPIPLRKGMFCCAKPSEPAGAWCQAHRKIVYRIWHRPRAPKPLN